MGCVANFAQEVVEGQSPLSVEGLSGQGVEQFGRSKALVSGLHPHLSFLEHGVFCPTCVVKISKCTNLQKLTNSPQAHDTCNSNGNERGSDR
jgi:hypothetical protein